jgi:hypothetical protein
MEYVEGQLVERNAGEYFHSRLQTLLATLLCSREPERRYCVFTELRLRTGSARYPIRCVSAGTTCRRYSISPIRPSKPSPPTTGFSSVLEELSNTCRPVSPTSQIVDPYQRVVFEAGTRTARGAKPSCDDHLTGEIDFAEPFAALDKPAE